jgi:hypothetical protein
MTEAASARLCLYLLPGDVGQEKLLTGSVGGSERAAAPVLVHRGCHHHEHHSSDGGGTVAIFCFSDDKDAASFSPPVSIGSDVERLASSHRRQRADGADDGRVDHEKRHIDSGGDTSIRLAHAE